MFIGKTQGISQNVQEELRFSLELNAALEIKFILPGKVRGFFQTLWPMAAPAGNLRPFHPVKARRVWLKIEEWAAIICVNIGNMDASVFIVDVNDLHGSKRDRIGADWRPGSEDSHGLRRLFIRFGRFKNGAGLLGVEVAEPPQYIEVAEAIQRSQCRDIFRLQLDDGAAFVVTDPANRIYLVSCHVYILHFLFGISTVDPDTV